MVLKKLIVVTDYHGNSFSIAKIFLLIFRGNYNYFPNTRCICSFYSGNRVFKNNAVLRKHMDNFGCLDINIRGGFTVNGTVILEDGLSLKPFL